MCGGKVVKTGSSSRVEGAKKNIRSARAKVRGKRGAGPPQNQTKKKKKKKTKKGNGEAWRMEKGKEEKKNCPRSGRMQRSTAKGIVVVVKKGVIVVFPAHLRLAKEVPTR